MKDPRSLIAVVDDDPFVRRAVSRLLASSGFDVDAYPSATAFLERPQVRPACLVTDIQMPGMSGLDLKQHLTKLEHDFPVIFVTADDDPRIRARAETLGAAGYFQKPFDGMALLDAIVRVTGNDLGD